MSRTKESNSISSLTYAVGILTTGVCELFVFLSRILLAATTNTKQLLTLLYVFLTVSVGKVQVILGLSITVLRAMLSEQLTE